MVFDDEVESLLSEDSGDEVEDSSLGDGNSSSGESSTAYASSGKDEFREVRNFTRKETKNVETWRDLVTGVLVITATFVTMASFIYLSRNETETFLLAFDQYVVTIKDTAVDLENSIDDSFTAVTDSITAHAQTSESVFPFVTVPFFEVHGHHARDISHVDFFSFCPLVAEANRQAWEDYSVFNQWWVQGDQIETYTTAEQVAIVTNETEQKIPSNIYRIDEQGHRTVNLGHPPYAPRWQISPPPSDVIVVNYDVLSTDTVKAIFDAMVVTNSPVMSGIVDNRLLQSAGVTEEAPSSLLVFPVYQNFNYSTPDIVGFLEVLFNWKTFLSLLLPEGQGGVYYVLQTSCGDEYTFENTNGEIIYIGPGDHHDIIYDRHVVTVDLITQPNITTSNNTTDTHICDYTVDVYPSAELRREFSTMIPEVFTFIVAASFFLMAFFFFTYDKFVQRRNEKVVRQAAKTNAIVSSLFPTNVRDRLFGGDNQSQKSKKTMGSSQGGGRGRLKNFLTDNMSANNSESGGGGASVGGGSVKSSDQPIADLFPHCTVLFADIVGFTAWSSMREPTQVFRLLESIYHAFDEIAKRRKVFKVETIGDCYVAVTGLPEPNKHHALVMAKFARDCMYKMHDVTRSLEVMLGPDTGDLTMRFGLHSGPVTAGVLRGERSRFQLFGDTVNTASRMESTGKKGCIHVSLETAEEVKESGKGAWLKERADKVTAKGKGEMVTYWLSLSDHSSNGDGLSEVGSFAPDNVSLDASTGNELIENASVKNAEDKKASYSGTVNRKKDLSGKNARLIEWNVDILQRVLRQIAAKRQVTDRGHFGKVSDKVHFGKGSDSKGKLAVEHAKPEMVLEEVCEVIQLPKFNSKVAGAIQRAEEVALPSDVSMQLHDFVAELAGMYHDNPFHNFEHASHVTMSVVKLLSRIVAPADLEYDDSNITNEKKLMKNIASKMHDHTYGITSDPLTQFSVVLSGLIHDVDHDGVTNAQLVKEETELAIRYKGKSVAEQNSVDRSWNLLMEPRFKKLRDAICGTEAEFARFRQLVVNSVMATDIVDKELKELRNGRWDKAFKGEFVETDPSIDINRKATIVIEHLIQASDISHTMQHWHIYRKWNERLFMEMYRAYRDGRAEKDPSEFWYKGEIGFFTFYIIPLAKKLKECGVFGVSSDEYLNYATKNLAEWKTKGEEVTKDMLERVKAEYGEEPLDS
ncbi:Receptor-type guanylate cyclase gcy [Seminavis robusta]|uniref:Receptor-type guanylate cyclase gcy n=1 Tax=Seminavis robusta TaxID=568900 RepID=A0A9N8HF37_9STRA|nr:Receptor-type guanylate cyclase gcy [Seminavis robusta]|eukprot:Sro330_g118970.1 Receptor-type guanylate cyclase gcy (1200) ;mRNA; f:54094-58678